MQTSAAQTEVLNDVKDLHRLLYISHLGLLCDDQVNVYICMDEITIDTSTHSPFDSH